MTVAALKDATRAVIGIPLGLYYIIVGWLMIAFWTIPAKLGSNLADQAVMNAQEGVQHGKDWLPF